MENNIEILNINNTEIGMKASKKNSIGGKTMKLFKKYIYKEIDLKNISGEKTTLNKYWEHLCSSDDSFILTFGEIEIKKDQSILHASWIGSVAQDILPVDGSYIECDICGLISYGADILLDTNNRINDIEIFREIGGGYCIDPDIEIVKGTPDRPLDWILSDFCEKLEKILK